MPAPKHISGSVAYQIDGIGRHPGAGLLAAQDTSFAYEVIALDAV